MEIRRCWHEGDGIGFDVSGRHHAIDQLLDELLDLVFAGGFEEETADAQGNGERWDQGQQSGVGKCRSAYGTAITAKAGPDEDPEMEELEKPRGLFPGPEQVPFPKRSSGFAEIIELGTSFRHSISPR